jgi:hypothetical protein
MGKYDYDALEKEFIQTDQSMSIRQFAKDHGITSWSALNVQANKRDWDQKRKDFHQRATEKAIAVAGDKMATKIMSIREDMLEVIHAATIKMGLDMQDRVITHTRENGTTWDEIIPGQSVTPDHLSKLIDKFLLLTGNATRVTEERSTRDVSVDFTGLPTDLTRAIADYASGLEPRADSRPRLPGQKVTGPN